MQETGCCRYYNYETLFYSNVFSTTHTTTTGASLTNITTITLTMVTLRKHVALLLLLCLTGTLQAQAFNACAFSSSPSATIAAEPPFVPDSIHENGTPQPGAALMAIMGSNTVLQYFNRFVLDASYARISPATVGQNFRTGFVWDNDPFYVNLLLHPYQGSIHFTTARHFGLSFWQSAPFAVGGSLMWEFVHECEPAAINDLLANSIGGIGLGEICFRLSNRLFDDSQRGWSRLWREGLAALLCPIQGLGRIVSGQAWQVKPAAAVPHGVARPPIAGSLGIGMRYLCDAASAPLGIATPLLQLSLDYGEAFAATSNRPFDYFTVKIGIVPSLQQPVVNHINILGRLSNIFEWSWPQSILSLGAYQYFNYHEANSLSADTDVAPYCFSETASLGAGLMFEHDNEHGSLNGMKGELHFGGMLLGSAASDYYRVIDRDYNLGSGLSLKARWEMEWNYCTRLQLQGNYYYLRTTKGYAPSLILEEMTRNELLYLNAQGDAGYTSLLHAEATIGHDLCEQHSVSLSAAYYLRDTHYTYRQDRHTHAWEITLCWQHRF